MLKAKFYLKNNKNAESLIICTVFQRSFKLVTLSSGLKTNPALWNKKTQELKPSSPIYREGNEVLNSLRRKVLNLSLHSEQYTDPTELKQFLRGELVSKVNDNTLDFHEVYNLYYSEKVRLRAVGTNKVYKSLPEKFTAYEKSKGIKLTFNYWSKSTMKMFANFLIERGYLDDTVSNNMKAVKAFLNWSNGDYHTNTGYKAYKVKWGTHNVISLTQEELNSVYNCNLSNSPTLDRVKDLFLLGCYTAQRFSDLLQFNSSQIQGNFWHVHSEKTRKLIRVPLSQKVIEILEKYDYSPPKISNQKFNQYLKEVGKQAGIDSLTEKVSYSGKNRTATTAPKYSFLTSHTARRTAITLLIERGVPLPVIQKLTGHSNIKTLLKYDGTTINNLCAYIEEL